MLYIGCRLALTYRDSPAAASAVLRLKIWPCVLNLINSCTLVFPSYPWSVFLRPSLDVRYCIVWISWLNGICFVTKHLLCNSHNFCSWQKTQLEFPFLLYILMVSESHLLWLLATSAWVLSFLFLSQVLSTRGGTSWHLCGIFKLPTSLHVYFKAISSIPKRVLLKYKHRSTGPGGAVIKTAVHEQESSTVQIS